jgi:hypothetical protein
MSGMSRGTRFVALTASVLLVVATPAAPASADDPYDVPDRATMA